MLQIPAGRSMLTVPYGCAVSTDELFITPAREIVHNITDWIVTVPIPVTPDIQLALKERYPSLAINDQELTKIVQELTRYKPTADLEDIATRANRQMETYHSTISWSGAVVSIFGATIIGGSIAWLWCRYRTRKRHTSKQPHYTMIRRTARKPTLPREEVTEKSRRPDSPKRGESIVE